MLRSLLVAMLVLLSGCPEDEAPVRVTPGEPNCGDVTRTELGLEGAACRARARG
jgi:hypothetical protein